MPRGLQGESQPRCCEITQHLLRMFNLPVEFVQFLHPPGLRGFDGLSNLLDIADRPGAAGPKSGLAFGQVGFDRLNFGREPGVFSIEPLQVHPHALEFFDDRFLPGLLLTFGLVGELSRLVVSHLPVPDDSWQGGTFPECSAFGFER